MSEEGENVIQTYLSLVRRYLPYDIADEIITELRHYIVDTATEAGNGEVTEKAAKQTVAKFGAPSEVAEEYVLSMFPERADDLHFDARPTQEKEQLEYDKELKEIPRVEEVEDQDNAYIETLVKTLYLYALLTLLGSVAAGGWVGFVFGIQASIGLPILTIFILMQKYRDVRLAELTIENWPLTKKLFILPVNLIPTASEIIFGVDLLAMIAACFAASYVVMMWEIWWINPLWIIVLAILAVIRLHIVFDRTEKGTSMDLALGQMAIDYALLFCLNLIVGIELARVTWNSWTIPAVLVILSYGAFLIFNILAVQQLYWQEYARKPVRVRKTRSRQEPAEARPVATEAYPEQAPGVEGKTEPEPSREEERPPEDEEDLKPVTGVYAKTFVLTLLWFVIGAVPLAVIFAVPFLIVLLFGFQFLPALGTVYLKMTRHHDDLAFFQRDYESDWSILKRLVSLPESIDESQNHILYKADIVLSLAGLAFLIFFTLTFGIFTGLGFLLVPLLCALAYRLKELNHWRKERETFNYRRFGQLDFVTLILGNFSIMVVLLTPTWWYYTPIGPGYGILLGQLAYLIMYSAFVLYRLVTTGREYSSKHEIETTAEEKSSREDLAVRWAKSLGRLVAYWGSLGIIGIVFGEIFLRGTSSYYEYLYTSTFFPFFYVLLPTIIITSIFFGIRMVFKPSSQRFKRMGKRGRISAGVSLLISAAFTFILFTHISQLTRVLQEGMFLASRFGGITVLFITLPLYLGIFSLFVSAFTHLYADLKDLANPASIQSIIALRLSGMMLLLAIAILSPILFHNRASWFIPFLGPIPAFEMFHIVLVPVLVQTAIAAEKNTIARENEEEPVEEEAVAEKKPPVPEPSTSD